MRLSEDVVKHVKSMSTEAGVPYQSLINLNLRDCLAQNRWRLPVRCRREAAQTTGIITRLGFDPGRGRAKRQVGMA